MRPTALPTIAALVVGIVAVSSSAPLIVYAAAPALAIAFWRNALAVGVLAPVAGTGRRRDSRSRSTRRRATSAFAASCVNHCSDLPPHHAIIRKQKP